VTSFTEIMPVTHHHLRWLSSSVDSFKENGLAGLSQEVLFEITEL
jgi:hypothetical protein